jgi:DNA-binding transcriptional regulator YhcF (GntR family)
MTIDKSVSGTPGGRAGLSSPGAGGGDGGTPPAGPRGSVSPIEFRLDAASGVPTYLQLVQQVEHALRLGYLKPGNQLPKVRDVVSLLAINPNTVLKAYRELEHKGLAAGRPGQGTFVEATLGQVALPELTALRRSLLGWLATADAAGLDEDGIVALFTTALRDFRGSGGRPPGQQSRDGRGGSGGRRGAAGGETEGVA